VGSKLLSHIKENNLVIANQSGFMPSDSTSNQLIFICDHILKGFEKGENYIAVFLDISKAFDKVWHRGLLVKLCNNGQRCNLLRWFESYLSD
jgi:hypothetical protein